MQKASGISLLFGTTTWPFNHVTSLPIELQSRILTASLVGYSELIHKHSQHFRPYAFLFITLVPQGLMGVTTLGGLWVTTLTSTNQEWGANLFSVNND